MGTLSNGALILRINRRLAKDDQAVRKCRETSRDHNELGDYYVVNTSMNVIVAKQVDLEEYGRELGVLAH